MKKERERNGDSLTGNPVTGRISIYDFPWVVYTDLNSQGYYNVTLLQYGSFTIGYKVSGYNTGFSKFTILSGNSKYYESN